MSGLVDRVKQLFSRDRADQVATAVEQNVTDERVDAAASRVPGGERVANKVPDDVGEKSADSIRNAAGSDDDEDEESQT